MTKQLIITVSPSEQNHKVYVFHSRNDLILFIWGFWCLPLKCFDAEIRDERWWCNPMLFKVKQTEACLVKYIYWKICKNWDK